MAKKKSTGLAAAVCVLLVLVIAVFILVKKDTIITNLKETNFFGRVFGKTPEFVENHESKKDKNDVIEDEEITIKVETVEKPEPVAQPKPKDDKKEQKTEAKPENKETKPQPKPEEKKETKKDAGKKEEPKKTTTTVTYSDVQLCFIEIDADGSLNRKIVKRSVPKNDSPLTNAINLLLAGPDTSKAGEKNCVSLIPPGSKLLSAKVSNGVAYLSFNEAFEMNPDGVEGSIGQLMQIVYTATSYSTVNSVQFLIEGQKKTFLGSEGQRIDAPLSRSSF
ncbi:MAG: GerMN domain-containing protein [Treponema sp.]|nr:GerMN domain-containing protein [Treponema sp.]